MKQCVFILIICICIVACGKPKGTPPPVVPVYVDSTYLTTTIDSVSFAIDSPVVVLPTYPNDSGKQDLSITATKTIAGVAYTLNFYITNFTGVDSFTIAPPRVAAAIYVNGTRHFAQSGQLIIATDSNSVLTGTFNFVADSITVTNGVFNVVL